MPLWGWGTEQRRQGEVLAAFWLRATSPRLEPAQRGRCRQLQSPLPSPDLLAICKPSNTTTPARPSGNKFLSSLAEQVKGKAREGNAQNTANTLWAFANLGERAAGASFPSNAVLGMLCLCHSAPRTAGNHPAASFVTPSPLLPLPFHRLSAGR